MKNFNDSYIGIRVDLMQHIKGKNIFLLDIGCATGENTKYVREQGILDYAEGVELDAEMGGLARNNLDKIIIGDIEHDHIFNQISIKQFDFIVIGDVLEHLRDPWNILQKLSEKLKPTGKIIFSVPNIGHIDVFIHVFIKGYWPYNERGIFDKTHIRMFTKLNIEELISSTNSLKLVQLERNFRYRDQIGSVFPFYGKVLRKFFPDLYTFQYVAICKKTP